MIRVKSSNDPRSGIQNGFWGFKIIALIAAGIGCLFIQQGSFDGFVFVLGCIGGFFFILWQLVLLVDYAHRINEGLLGKLDEAEDERPWKCLLFFFSFGTFIASFVWIVCLYVYFGKTGCGLNQFFISLVLILSIVGAVVSINPTVQENNEASGILQAAVVSLYAVKIERNI